MWMQNNTNHDIYVCWKYINASNNYRQIKYNPNKKILQSYHLSFGKKISNTFSKYSKHTKVDLQLDHYHN